MQERDLPCYALHRQPKHEHALTGGHHADVTGRLEFDAFDDLNFWLLDDPRKHHRVKHWPKNGAALARTSCVPAESQKKWEDRSSLGLVASCLGSRVHEQP